MKKTTGMILTQFGEDDPKGALWAQKIDRRHLWWLVGGLALIVLLAYGQTLGMYFWQDDAALLFKMQHPIPNSGSFGSGYFGTGAYKYLATPFIPLLPLFGLNPLPYFALGIVIYLAMTLVVFWFLRVLTQNNRIASSGAVLFASGYFAQLAIFRLINSYQTNFAVILSLATFGVLIWYHLSKKWWWYLLAVGLFAATLELMLVRSHGLIIPVVALEGLFLISTLDSRFWTLEAKVESRKSKVAQKTWFEYTKQFVFAILRLIPFTYVYYFYYLSSASASSNGALSSLYQTYWIEGKWENFLGLAASFGNMMIPDAVIKWFSESTGVSIGLTNWSHLLVFGIFLLLVWASKWRLKLHWSFGVTSTLLGAGWLWINILGAQAQYSWYQDFASILAGTVGGLAIVYYTLLAFYLWRRSRLLSIAILFSLVWSVANYFGYFVLYPTSIMSSTTRYVMHSFVSTVALWAILIELLFVRAPVGNSSEVSKARLLRGERDRGESSPTWLPTAVVTGILMLLPLSLTITDQQNWVTNTSQPTRAFYQTMQKLYPKLEYGALIWYDTKRDPTVEHAFGDFFAVGSMPDETALAIYYGIDRYDLKLANGANNFLSDSLNLKKNNRMLYTFYYDGKELHSTTEHTRAALGGQLQSVDLNFAGGTLKPAAPVGMSTPVVLDVDLAVKVKPAVDLAATGAWEGKIDELPTYFAYLEARDSLRRQLKVSVSSEWSGAEKEFLIDGTDKGWVAHRTIWPVEKQASATLELPSLMDVNRILWTNSHTIRTPQDYTVETSLDGSKWQVVKTVTGAKDRPTAELVAEDFDSVQARFVRMVITKSSTGEAPGLVELSVAPTKFGRLDSVLADKLAADPLIGAQDDASKQALEAYLKTHKSVGVTYQTDRAISSGHDPITIQLTDAKHYQVILPASGTELQEIRFVTPAYLGDVKVENAKISFPTLDKLNELGFIERRSKN